MVCTGKFVGIPHHDCRGSVGELSPTGLVLDADTEPRQLWRGKPSLSPLLAVGVRLGPRVNITEEK
jgi:hypothetical protein